MRTVLWCVGGMRHHAEKIAQHLDLPLFVDIPIGDNFDNVVIYGMYDPPFYNHTFDCTKRVKTKHIHWCGSDVLWLRPDTEHMVEATHSCETSWLAKELYEKGIEDVDVIMSPTQLHPEPTPLPSLPAVSTYVGSSDDPQKYGVGLVQACMEILKDVPFVVYSLGANNQDEMLELIDKTTVHLRLAPHDGSALSVREYLEAGRPCVTCTPLEGVKQVRYGDLLGTVEALREALKAKEPNMQISKYYKVLNSVERFKEEATEKWHL